MLIVYTLHFITCFITNYIFYTSTNKKKKMNHLRLIFYSSCFMFDYMFLFLYGLIQHLLLLPI